MNICLIGLCYHQFRIGGEKKLKSYITTIQDNINLLCSVIDVPIKELDIKKIAGFIGAASMAVKKALKTVEVFNMEKQSQFFQRYQYE